MTWFRVDDKLHDHRKVRKAGKTAMGVWVLAGSWSMDNETDGFIPADVLSRWGAPTDAGRLVSAGFWYVDSFEGEKGWRFHDWSHFQPSAAVTAAKRAAEHEAGLRGNHKRWHVARKISDPDCQFCYQVPDREPDGVPDDDPIGVPESPPNPLLGESAPIPPVPVPVPTTSSNEDVEDDVRDDVRRICDYLAAAVMENGSREPTVTKTWRDAARLMLDKDGRTEGEVIRAIDWCQRGESKQARFWRPNVMSMPKLREKFDQMRLQAAQEARPEQPSESNAQGWLRLATEQAELDNVSPFRAIGGAS